MPATCPSYPHGPYRFMRREYLIITYETDPDALRAALRAAAAGTRTATSPSTKMKMPDSSGFGDYEESGSAIVASWNGEPCNYSVQMYLDDEPPISAGREIWGFPKKYDGVPR